MRIAIIGAGPAGLYFATVLKRSVPAVDLVIVERNSKDVTFGFGVVFSDTALDFLHAGDPETHALLTPHFEHWHDLTLQTRGESIAIDGVGFSAISRLNLLQLLGSQLAMLGIEPTYDAPVEDLSVFDDFDLIVGADGAKSFVRQNAGEDFGTTLHHQTNRYIWFGAEKPFETLTQSFVRGEHGVYNAHHYRYSAGMSTFIVETNETTWRNAGLAAMDAGQSRRHCEAVFAGVLGGARLVANGSRWLRFATLVNERWSAGKHVLIGDAAHTAHFSVGSGTRLALEDAFALAKSITGYGDDLESALKTYEMIRRPVVDKIAGAARQSADWYDDFEAHMDMDPWPFARAYMNRTGRIDEDRLKRVAPKFADGCRTRGL